MQLTALDKELHDRMLISQILKYQNEDFVVVAANHEGWPTPEKVGNCVPDIIAQRRGHIIFNEVETCSTIILKETRIQCEEIVKEGQLEITIPYTCYYTARSTFSDWGIPVARWWRYAGP